jgi:TatD DNase family protein
MKPALIDTHCHLDDPRYDGAVEAVLARARNAGVQRMVSIGIDLATSRQAVALAEEHPRLVSAAVGLMPHGAQDYDADYGDALEDLAGRPGVVAWGEIGLDYHHERSPRDVQRRVFLDQLRRARRLGLPVVVHSREAADDTLAALAEAADYPVLRDQPYGVLHCFSGAERHARRAFELGYLLGIAGPVTFTNARDFQRLVARLPLEQLVVETDAPYLSPHPFRGKCNEPARVALVLAKVAELHEVDYAAAARTTTDNARRLFRLPASTADAGDFCYRLGSRIYLNVTNRCNNDCYFCIRCRRLGLAGYQLWLNREPTTAELLDCAAAELERAPAEEVVFCGFGEPLLRLDTVQEVAGSLKQAGRRVRIDTNGTAQLELELTAAELVRRLRPVVDRLGVSLNASNAEEYVRLCRPAAGEAAFDAVKEFIGAAVAAGVPVTASAVAVPGLDVEAVAELASALGADFRRRSFHDEDQA